MQTRWTLQHFEAAVSATRIHSFLMLDACRDVLVGGASQKSTAERFGIDQGQLSKACKTLRRAPLDRVADVIAALDAMVPLIEADVLPERIEFPDDYGSAEIIDVRMGFRALADWLAQELGEPIREAD